MIKEPIVYLRHVLESIELIERRIANLSRVEFLKDVDIQDMIVRRLEVIGESVRNLPKEFRVSHSEVNWQGPADMRSALIHGYLEVDYEIVWDTVRNDLPKFKQQITRLLGQIDKG